MIGFEFVFSLLVCYLDLVYGVVWLMGDLL